MSEDVKYHIILLPRADYWDWVNAVREYAIHFGVSVTPRPENAIRFHRPSQVISVVNLPGGYPAYGDVVRWLQAQAPEVPLDVLDVTTPSALRDLLRGRIAVGLRFGSEAAPEEEPSSPEPETDFRLRWPTDYPIITQGFGENPDVYRRWGLPGHEGVDIRAPLNANVYACADGVVYRVHDGTGNHPYGVHIRIQHADGYRTIYAHLNRALVHSGQTVRAGDLIGLANSTGNSTGHHLHLTLKKEGATAAGLTTYPRDIIDPTPFLVSPDELPAPPSDVWPYDHVLVGLHGRADGPMQEPDWGVVETARVEALKLSSSAAPEDVARAWRINSDMFIMVRLFADFRNRVVRAADFARWVEPDMQRFYDQGVRYYEVHNEPNLTPEGYGTSWRDGRGFGEWFVEVMGLLKAKFPEARFGWPGLSPGPATPGMRSDEEAFLESASDFIEHADWIGCHCYWQNRADMFSLEGGLRYQLYRELWPRKLLFITEFSNTSPSVDLQTKGDEYVEYYRHLRNQSGIGAAFAFVVSASANFPYEVWRREDGQPTPIAGLVGARSF